MGDIGPEWAQHGFARQLQQGLVGQQAGGVQPGQQSCGDVAHVAFYAGNLAGQEQVGAGPGLQAGQEQFRRSQEGVAVHLPVAYKLGLFKTRNHAKNAALFGEAQVGLETHQIVQVSGQVILA